METKNGSAGSTQSSEGKKGSPRPPVNRAHRTVALAALAVLVSLAVYGFVQHGRFGLFGGKIPVSISSFSPTGEVDDRTNFNFEFTYNPEYTVGVWIGNFNGREAERLVGAEVAAPLLFDIFNALSNSGAWFGKPTSVGVRKVCPLSGRLATENCPETVDELYIYGVSPTAQCDMHRKFYIDDETGLRLSISCRAGRGYKEKLFVIWPREIAMWMKREGWPVEDVPEYRKDCGAFASGQAPVIISPQADVEYYMRDDAPAEHQKIPLDAAVSNTVNEVFWFVDGEMLASGPPTEKHFYFPARGRHRIICMDSEGYSSAVTININ